MVNSEEFTKRLNKIIEFYDLSAASFADKIDVGRSSISHLLSCRNKPSLDFVMKVVAAFPEVELYWLLNGKGTFPKSDTQTPSPTFSKTKNDPRVVTDLFSANNEDISADLINDVTEKKKKQIKKVVIFYNDGTFEAYEKSE